MFLFKTALRPPYQQILNKVPNLLVFSVMSDESKFGLPCGCASYFAKEEKWCIFILYWWRSGMMSWEVAAIISLYMPCCNTYICFCLWYVLGKEMLLASSCLNACPEECRNLFNNSGNGDLRSICVCYLLWLMWCDFWLQTKLMVKIISSWTSQCKHTCTHTYILK